MSTNPPTNPAPLPQGANANRILEALAGLRFGSVEIVVHDGRVVQIERKEKIRIDSGSKDTR